MSDGGHLLAFRAWAPGERRGGLASTNTSAPHQLPFAHRRVDEVTMWRVLNVVEQMSSTLVDASRYLEDALRAIDQETTTLEARLHADAANLRAGIAGADLSPVDSATLLETLDRFERTAESVAAFTHRRRNEV